MRNVILFVIRKLLVPPYFHISRVFKDQFFLYRLENTSLNPNTIYLPAIFIMRAWIYVTRIIRQEFTSYSLSKYNRYIYLHYSKDGRGYFSYDSLTDSEKDALYGNPAGRIEAFITQYSELLKYKDGDRFFDAGCGRGQNIKSLRSIYGKSFIYGIDLSNEAINVIKNVVDDEKLKVESADLKDMSVYEALEDNSFDHVIISHVFSLIMGPDLEQTKALRQKIIKEVIRVAKKSVLIIDGPDIIATEERFEIEQANRGVFYESIEAYFPKNEGITLTLRTEESVGVLFKK